MADNKDNSTQQEAIENAANKKETVNKSASSAPSTRQADTSKKSSGNGLLWFVVLVIFLLVIGMAGAGYWYYLQQSNASQQTSIVQQQQLSQFNAIEKERTAINASLREVTQTNEALKNSLNELKSKNDALDIQLKSTLEQLNNMEGRRPADWLIAEADYLVRMAGRKLWLENDVRTAILLLVNADKRLKSLADPSILPVRAHLAEDIQTLQQLNPVSQSSVALALSGMMAQIDKLPLDTFEKPEDSDSNDTQLSESTDDWKDNLAKVWRSLVADFLTIKTIEEPVEPVMSLQAQFLVKEQLRLQLMHAQSAALKAEAGLYQQSLQYALTILNDKFKSGSTQVTGFVNALQNLMGTDVSRPIPSELASQQPLEKLLDSRVKQVFGQGASAL
ncbi:uroporphyrinogen-III C-methyltransferase [Alteromonas sp. D210916BOD_24]|uniref:uroporphyrinogen-III C-methyltransferase n=1 Tax=Alteromonas sp. D210916BOD_24 TaxID=3157618 RepID=UPI00399D2B4F